MLAAPWGAGELLAAAQLRCPRAWLWAPAPLEKGSGRKHISKWTRKGGAESCLTPRPECGLRGRRLPGTRPLPRQRCPAPGAQGREAAGGGGRPASSLAPAAAGPRGKRGPLPGPGPPLGSAQSPAGAGRYRGAPVVAGTRSHRAAGGSGAHGAGSTRPARGPAGLPRAAPRPAPRSPAASGSGGAPGTGRRPAQGAAPHAPAPAGACPGRRGTTPGALAAFLRRVPASGPPRRRRGRRSRPGKPGRTPGRSPRCPPGRGRRAAAAACRLPRRHGEPRRSGAGRGEARPGWGGGRRAAGRRRAGRRLTHSPVAAAGVDLGERGGAAGLQGRRAALRRQQRQRQQRQSAGPPRAAAHRAGAARRPAALRRGAGSGSVWAKRCRRRRRRPPFIPSRDRARAELPRLTPPHGAGAAAAPGPPCLRPASGGGGGRRRQPRPPPPASLPAPAGSGRGGGGEARGCRPRGLGPLLRRAALASGRGGSPRAGTRPTGFPGGAPRRRCPPRSRRSRPGPLGAALPRLHGACWGRLPCPPVSAPAAGSRALSSLGQDRPTLPLGLFSRLHPKSSGFAEASFPSAPFVLRGLVLGGGPGGREGSLGPGRGGHGRCWRCPARPASPAPPRPRPLCGARRQQRAPAGAGGHGAAAGGRRLRGGRRGFGRRRGDGRGTRWAGLPSAAGLRAPVRGWTWPKGLHALGTGCRASGPG